MLSTTPHHPLYRKVHTMSDKFHNANGSLTRYAFMCGYIEEHRVADRFSVRLSAEGVYHVKVRDDMADSGLAAWECYETLTEARVAVRAAKRYFSRMASTPAESLARDTSTDATAPWDR